MSKIDYVFRKSKPPKPDVYVTRRGKSSYLTRRYWDGENWFEINFSDSRGGKSFTWPKNSITKEPRPKWRWEKQTQGRYSFVTRQINVGKDKIEWGEPIVVFDEKEVLKYLVETGMIWDDWKTRFQQEMREYYGKTNVKGGW